MKKETKYCAQEIMIPIGAFLLLIGVYWGAQKYADYKFDRDNALPTIKQHR